MIRTLIVDDEELARKRLGKMLAEYTDRLEVIGEAVNGLDAIEKIKELKPDLVFLDIQMPGKTGFEVLHALENPPKIIFATAFDEYAIKAFEENAIGYLLKPIDKDSLEKTLSKIDFGNMEDEEKIARIVQKILSENSGANYLKRLQVKVGDRTLLLEPKDILYFESQDKYTNVHTVDHLYIIDTPLVELEKRLDPNLFIRIHRATLVNVDWIEEIHRYIGGKLQVQLKTEKKTLLTVSRSYTDNVRSL